MPIGQVQSTKVGPFLLFKSSKLLRFFSISFKYEEKLQDEALFLVTIQFYIKYYQIAH